MKELFEKLKEIWLSTPPYRSTPEYKAGNDAYYDGSNIESNPHIKGSRVYSNWNKGFNGQ